MSSEDVFHRFGNSRRLEKGRTQTRRFPAWSPAREECDMQVPHLGSMEGAACRPRSCCRELSSPFQTDQCLTSADPADRLHAHLCLRRSEPQRTPLSSLDCFGRQQRVVFFRRVARPVPRVCCSVRITYSRHLEFAAMFLQTGARVSSLPRRDCCKCFCIHHFSSQLVVRGYALR